MTTDTLFTLRMAAAQSEEQAREIAAKGGLASGALELRVVPVDAEGRVIAVAGPEEVQRVMIDLRVLPPQADAQPAGTVDARSEDTTGFRHRPPTPGPMPEPPTKIWHLSPGVALRMPLVDPAPVDDQDVQGFIWPVVLVVGGLVIAGGAGYVAGYATGRADGFVEGAETWKQHAP